MDADLKKLENIVRVGTVSSVDIGSRTARVEFKDKGTAFVSGRLVVLQNQPFIPYYYVTQETEPRGGGSGDAAFESHTHELKILPWLPRVGQMVLCIMLPNGDGDGFVIGGM